MISERIKSYEINSKGKVSIFFIGSAHGNEINSSKMLYYIMNILKADTSIVNKNINTLYFLPFANKSAIRNKTREVAYYGANQNDAYDECGEYLRDSIKLYITSLIKSYDGTNKKLIVVDCHNSECVYPSVSIDTCCKNYRKIERITYEFNEQSTTNMYVLKWHTANENLKDWYNNYYNDYGFAVTYESTGISNSMDWNESIALSASLLLNYLNFCIDKFNDFYLNDDNIKDFYYHNIIPLAANADGIIEYLYPITHFYKANDIIAYIRNIDDYNTIVGAIIAPNDGICIDRGSNYYVMYGISVCDFFIINE